MKNKLGILSLALIAFSSVSVSHIQQADAAVRLGRVDLPTYCMYKYPLPKTTLAVLVGNDAYSWRCRAHYGFAMFYNLVSRDYGIDMNDVCRRQYGNSAYARTNNPSSPYSWECYR